MWRLRARSNTDVHSVQIKLNQTTKETQLFFLTCKNTACIYWSHVAVTLESENKRQRKQGGTHNRPISTFKPKPRSVQTLVVLYPNNDVLWVLLLLYSQRHFMYTRTYMYIDFSMYPVLTWLSIIIHFFPTFFHTFFLLLQGRTERTVVCRWIQSL